MKKAELIKKVVKTNVGEKPTFGTDPNDPWSAKAGITEDTINETPLLNRYLKSRGINPEFVTKDQKVAHSKTNQFKTWMVSHANDPIKEGMTTEPSPTQKRLQVLKSTTHKHKEIRVPDGQKKLHTEEEQLDEISPELQHRYFKARYAQHPQRKGTPKKVRQGMDKVINRSLKRNTLDTPGASKDFKDQEAKRGIGHVRDHVETDGNQLDETWKYHTYPTNAEAHAAVKTHHAWRGEDGMASGNPARAMGKGKIAYKGEFKGPKPQKVSEGVVDAVKRAWKSVSNFDDPSPKYDGQTRRRQALKKKLAADKKKVSEAKEANYGGDYQQSVLNLKAKAEKKPVDMKSLAARMQASYKKDKDLKKEDFFHGGTAANAMPFDGANNTDDTIPAKRSTASKVKTLLKKTVKEEMYDHEKEDKSTAPLAKKTKFQKGEIDSATKESPQAAAVLSGGKTLTGEPRDTIEIDPMMKMRKQAGFPQDSDKAKKSI